MPPTVFLAAFEEDVLPFLLGFGLLVLVPIVWMLLKHQRQMAEIIHRGREEEKTDERVLQRLDQIQRELADLRQRQNDTILALEDRRTPSTEVQRRVSE